MLESATCPDCGDVLRPDRFHQCVLQCEICAEPGCYDCKAEAEKLADKAERIAAVGRAISPSEDTTP